MQMAPIQGNSRGPLDLDVGIVYTHECHYIDSLLATLAVSAPGLAMRLVLVDNASTDGLEPWHGRLPDTQVLHNDRRLGYAENMNRVLRASTARYVLVMNTDMYFDPHEAALTRLVRFMDANPLCGLATCRLHRPDGSNCYPARRYQTLPIIAARRLGMSRVFAQQLRQYLYQERDARDSFACEWVSGCFMLLRREAIVDVGPFDTGFRKYFEDVDMCARMTQAGWHVMYHGGTYLFHYEQRASIRILSGDGWQHLRSYARWFGKWGFRRPTLLEPATIHLPPQFVSTRAA